MELLTVEQMNDWNRISLASSSTRAMRRWKCLNGSLRDKKDKVEHYLHIWYGPYGWGVTGELVN